MKGEVCQLGLGEPIGISAEHGDGLLDMFDVLRPFGGLLNLSKPADQKVYEQYLQENKQSLEEDQPFEVATNVDMACLVGWSYVGSQGPRQ